jgi:hypothetical protein
MIKNKVVIYALTRGYSGAKKINYRFIIMRNLAIKFNLAKSNFDLILFHEGNITTLDKILIKFLSLSKVKFIDISQDFKPFIENKFTNESRFPLSYSLMCQFQYLHVWKYLKKYDIAVRIDEDCIILNLELNLEEEVLECGYISVESHIETNSTLPLFLAKIKQEMYYDHLFPYTNVFITNIQFWLDEKVQKFLFDIYLHPDSLNSRWGDLPVLGVTLKKFANWDSKKAINKKIFYYHHSHRVYVENGRLIQNPIITRRNIIFVFLFIEKILSRLRNIYRSNI